MRGKTAASSTNSTNANSTMRTDDHRHGLYALSPLALVVLILISGGAYVVFSELQITSTEQSVLSLLQVGVQLHPDMTTGQVVAYLHGTLDHYETIAGAIGYGVQIALLMLSFPPDAALFSLHKKYNVAVPAPSLGRSASTLAKVRKLFMVILIGGDIVTDFVYVTQGHTLFLMNGWLPVMSSANTGVLIVGVVYPVALCFVTIFVGKYLFAFVDALVDQLLALTRPAKKEA